MKDEIQLFNFHDKQVRTVSIEGEPYFVGKDVAKILGYKHGSRDITAHTDEEDRLRYQISTAGQMCEQTIINESGLYSLILSSQLPKAKEFKHWVTSEVLPAIRKRGAYMTGYMTGQRIKEVLLNPDTVIQLATELKDKHYRQIDWDKNFLEQ